MEPESLLIDERLMAGEAVPAEDVLVAAVAEIKAAQRFDLSGSERAVPPGHMTPDLLINELLDAITRLREVARVDSAGDRDDE